MNLHSYLAALLLFPLLSCNGVVESKRESPLPGLQTQTTGTTGTANLVFRSADGGQTWQDISNGLPQTAQNNFDIGRNAFFAGDDGLYLTDGNSIYHSNTNSSAPFWTKAAFPHNQSGITPGKRGIFAYNYGSGGIVQTNATGEWSPVFTHFREKRVFSVFETRRGTVFIGSDRGLFKSTDGGGSWKQLQIGGGGKLVESNGVLLATGESGIVRSADEGETWASVISEGGVGIDVERIEGGFAAINYSARAGTRRVRTSYDGGKTWQPIDAGFPGQEMMESKTDAMYSGTPGTMNIDSAWHPKEPVVAPPEYKTSIIQFGENFFCGHTDGVFKTSDRGKTWKRVLPSIKGKMFKLVVSGNVIYAIQVESHC